MDSQDKPKTSPIIIHGDNGEKEAPQCSVDSPCALPPRMRWQIAAFATIAIAIASGLLYGIYWLAIQFGWAQ